MTAPPDQTDPPPPPGLLRRLLWPDWQRRKRMLRLEAWAVVAASYALLAFAYLWPPDYRNESPAYVLAAWAAFMVRTLQFHLGLLLVVVTAGALLGRGRRLALAALPPMLMALGPAARHYAPKPAPAAAASGAPTLRVMTANLLMSNERTDGILGEVLAARPDVLVLQEYTDAWHAAASKALRPAYPYSSFVTQDDSFGVAIYSRTPFVGAPDNRVPLGRALVPQTRAVVRFGGREVAVYNIHLLPPRRLDYTTEARLQFADLMTTLREETLPYVVAGDFNFTESAPQHADLRRLGAADAHDKVGRGRAATWPVNSVFRYLPGLRLDHVYVGGGLGPVTCRTGVGAGSDHRPVVVDVAFGP